MSSESGTSKRNLYS